MNVSVLVLCRHDGIRETMLRLVNNNPNWTAEGAGDVHDACRLLATNAYNIVLLGNGFSKEEESHIVNYAGSHAPAAKVVFHFGGGSGLLLTEISQALHAG